MTYIDRLNQFNRWLESNALPGNAQLMYFKLLNVFNRAGWPESVQVDNQRLMIMTDIQAENTAIRARDKLVAAGLLRYEKGKKGQPNRYKLIDIHWNDSSISGSTSVSISGSKSGGISGGTSGGYIKNKNKTKKKTEYYTCSLREQGVEPTYDIKELEELAYLRIPDKL